LPSIIYKESLRLTAMAMGPPANMD
jgi:hypothetical protein